MSAFLVAELREMRVSRGLSQEEFGKVVNYSGSHVSSVETGQRVPTGEYVAAIDKAFQTGGVYGRLLAQVTSLDAAPVWLRPWIEFEREAVALKSFEPLVVPGLLQIEAYARALLSAAFLTPAQLEQQVQARLDRQVVLAAEQPPLFIAVLDVMVLRREIGGPAVMREQLGHLLKMAEQPNVRIHVVPENVGAYLGLAGPFVIATLPGNRDVAYLDKQLEGVVVDRPDELLAIRDAWEAVRGTALPHQQSIKVIRDVMATWT